MEKETPSIRQRLELLKLKVVATTFSGGDNAQGLVDKLNDTIDSVEELVDILLDLSKFN